MAAAETLSRIVRQRHWRRAGWRTGDAEPAPWAGAGRPAPAGSCPAWRWLRSFLLAWMCLGPAGSSGSAEPEVLVEGLEAPAAVTLDADQQRLLVALADRGEIVAISLNADPPSAPKVLVSGFTPHRWPDAQGLPVSPAGMRGIGRDTLAVSHVDREGSPRVSVYALDAAPDSGPAQAGQPVRQHGFKTPADGRQLGRLAGTGATLYATTLGSAEQAPLLRLAVAGSVPAEAFGEPLMQHPMGLAVSPRGELAVAGLGNLGEQPDAQLALVHAASGRPLLQLTTDRWDLVAVAYSPQGLLYVLDLAWARPEEAGLYRVDATLVDQRLAVVTQRIAHLERPTDMVFARDGALYIAQLGGDSGGSLLRIAPGL